MAAPGDRDLVSAPTVVFDARRLVPPRPTSAKLHAALAIATFVTLSIAGGLVWEPLAPAVETLRQLLEPARLWQTVRAGLGYATLTFLVLGAHEMGHYLACRHYGIPCSLPYFIPGLPFVGSFGAVIRIRGAIPHRRALFDVAAAGPFAGFAVAMPILLVGVLRARPFTSLPDAADAVGAYRLGEPVLLTLLQRLFSSADEIAANAWIGAGWVGMLVTSLNLFPVGQLDGGHAAYAFSGRVHRVLTLATLAALFAIIAVQALVFAEFPFYSVWFAILLWMRDRHPRLVDESGTLGRGRTLAALGLVLVFALSFILVPIQVG